ncbi:MAG: efflux RND transporter periplasmic adaptor subunit [Bacteroidales bacterium]|nr:efflux RND transporter periplasmic adaptor subunit [Bacteroidales bacterium]MDT8372773.1 efflux RND transporter periplasmic adaptor subunit [Bacteroidales bacterium]
MKSILYMLFVLLLAGIAACAPSSDAGHESEEEHDHEAVTTGAHKEEPGPATVIPGSHAQDSAHFEIVTLVTQPFSFVLKTGGRIMADNRDLITITSKSSGLVKFGEEFLLPGVKISQGQALFSVAGGNLSDDNTDLRFRQIKSDLDRARMNFERAEKLIAEKIITEEHYLAARNEFEKISSEYDNIEAVYGTGGSRVIAPVSGYIRDIFVADGQKVMAGQPMASVISGRRLVLRADVRPDDLAAASSAVSANFKVGYSDRIFKTVEMNGRKISYGKSTGESSLLIPVYFSLDYEPELIEGTYAEVYLIGRQAADALTVPNSALMEEFGRLYVFVAHEDGDFDKKYITTGYSDGEKTQVLSGLNEGERIVASGTYLVKLSQMSVSAPAHNH